MSQREWMLDFMARLERLQPLLPAELRGRAAALAEYREACLARAYDHAAVYHARKLHALQFPPVNTDWNGHLAAVPGPLQAQGARSLPEPSGAAIDRAAVEIDAGGFGRFRVFYDRRKLITSRSSGWHWFAYRADLL